MAGKKTRIRSAPRNPRGKKHDELLPVTSEGVGLTETGSGIPGLLPDALVSDIRGLIESARVRVAVGVNAEMVMLHWDIGSRIRNEILGDQRAEYGKQVIDALSIWLTERFGTGFTRSNLFHMVRFAEVFPGREIVYALSRQLSWTHFRTLMYISDPLQRQFYTEMCRLERWSSRVLDAKIQGMLYERTALSKKPEDLAKKELDALRDEDRLTPDLIFRDPYFLDFLGLADTYSEQDLENAILKELERFILELGTDFSFIARQKRITVDNEDFYIDLLFYHRKLRRLVAIDLKLGKFRPADMGQMELYLRWLDRYDRQPAEDSPLGLILCAGKSLERIELLQLEDRGIRVSEYLTELPPRRVLEEKLHAAVRIARERFGRTGKHKRKLTGKEAPDE